MNCARSSHLALVLTLSVLGLACGCSRAGLKPDEQTLARTPVFKDWGPADPPRDPRASRSDFQIRTDLLAAMSADPQVDVFNYRVKVSNGAVTLSGSPSSTEEAAHALRMTRHLPGVKGVDDRMNRPLPRFEPGADAPEESEADLESEIRQAIVSRDTLQMSMPAVKVRDGVAILSGKVRYLRSKMIAEEEARRTPGIHHVVNHIEVGGFEGIEDEKLRRTILAALRVFHPVEDPERVQVDVHEGVVGISGKINTPREKRALLATVSQIRGVRDIRSRLD